MARWLVPAAAMLLLAVGIHVRRQSLAQPAEQQQAPVAVPVANLSGLNDEDLLQEVADNAPAMQVQYEENLRRVNDSIRDDAGAWSTKVRTTKKRGASLMDAYQQKSMLFEMAMDRPRCHRW